MLSRILFEKLSLLPNDPVAIRRVEGYYLPIYRYIKKICFDSDSSLPSDDSSHGAGSSSHRKPPLFVGISAPQVSFAYWLLHPFISLWSNSFHNFFRARGKRLWLTAYNTYLSLKARDVLWCLSMTFIVKAKIKTV
jgi:hypothetical protein